MVHWFQGRIPYRSMSEEERMDLLPHTLRRTHQVMKALAQCQTFLGLACMAIGAISDYVSSGFGKESGLRIEGVPEFCGLYFMLTGLIGTCGAASYRRGLLVAYLVMTLHACLIFVPAMVGTCIAGILMSNKDCWLKMDWDGDSYGVFCGQNAQEKLKTSPG